MIRQYRNIDFLKAPVYRQDVFIRAIADVASAEISDTIISDCVRLVATVDSWIMFTNTDKVAANIGHFISANQPYDFTKPSGTTKISVVAVGSIVGILYVTEFNSINATKPDPINFGIMVPWTYAGGATITIPVTIWSENTGDANNQITVKYNGFMAWITKRVGGVSKYVVVPSVALAAGTYPVTITLNSNQTMKLNLNGTSSADGTTQIITQPLDFTRAAQLFSVAGSAGSLTATGFTATTTGQAFVSRTSLLSQGRMFITAPTGTASSGTLVWFGNSASPVAVATMGQTVDYIAIGINTAGSGFTLTGHSAGATVTGCTLSVLRVDNNTDTTAIPWATVL